MWGHILWSRIWVKNLQISLAWSRPSTSWTTVKACIEGLQKGGGWQDGRRWCPWWWSAWSCPRASWWRGRGAPWTNIMRCRSVCLSIVAVEDQVLKWGKTVAILCWQLASSCNKCHVKLVRATTQQVTAETWSQAHWTNPILLFTSFTLSNWNRLMEVKASYSLTAAVTLETWSGPFYCSRITHQSFKQRQNRNKKLECLIFVQIKAGGRQIRYQWIWEEKYIIENHIKYTSISASFEKHNPSETTAHNE